MRESLFSLVGLGLCACLLTACASTPSHDQIQASFDAGLKAYDAGDFKTAYHVWDDIGDYDLAALRNVALMLREGQGVDKDAKAALAKMARAADLGLVTAQADVGEMLINGEGAPADKAAAVPWLARAAEVGHPIAAFELAQIYEEGKAVPQDLKQARRLYEIAAGAGMLEAAERLKALDGAVSARPAATQGPLPPTAP